MTFDPSRHPRAAAGAAGGGRFVTGQSDPKKDNAAKGAKKKLGGKLDAAAIRRFQKQHGLQVDGVIGLQTSKALLGNFSGAKNSKTGAMTREQQRRLSMLGGGSGKPVRGAPGVSVHQPRSSGARSNQPRSSSPRRKKVSVGGVHAGYIVTSSQPHASEVAYLAHDHTGERLSSHSSQPAAARAVAANHRAKGMPGAITTKPPSKIAGWGQANPNFKRKSRRPRRPTNQASSVGTTQP